MHILVVTQYFWPENFRINDLVEGFVERGHKVTVLTGMPNYPEGSLYKGYGLFSPGREEYCGATVIRVPLVPRGKGGGVRLAINYLSFVATACLLGPLRCREQYDVTFIFEPSPVTVALPALVMKGVQRMPVMFWVQDLWPESLAATGVVTSPAVLGAVGKLVRFIYRGCDRILVTSKAFIPSVTQYVEDRGQILYFPQYGENLYQPVSLPDDAPERSLVPAGFVVMFAGNIGEAQDFHTILKAAYNLRDRKEIHFVIVGDGRMRRKVEEEVKRLGIGQTFHLLGRHPLERMPAFFSLADAMLVTLKREPIFALTIPAKIQSYLACSRPVIAALDGEGAKVVTEAGAGFACPAEDPEGLAETILKMYETPKAERERMGTLGKQYYDANFDRTMLIDRLFSWMEALTGGKGSVK